MITCPECNTSDQVVNLEYDDPDLVGYYGMACDLTEYYCKKCCTAIPICQVCNEILHYIGCIGYVCHDTYMVHLNGNIKDCDFINDDDSELLKIIIDPSNNGPISDQFSYNKTGILIPYFVHPQPGFNENRSHPDIMDTGPDGDYPTFWWCPICNEVTEQKNK